MRFIQEGCRRVQQGQPTMKGTRVTIEEILQTIAGNQEAMEAVSEELGVSTFDLQGTVYELAMLVKEKGLPKELYSVQD